MDSDLQKLRERFVRTPEEEAKILAKIKEEDERQEELRLANIRTDFYNYIETLPKRYKEASFENIIGLEEDREKVERLTGGIIYGSNGNGKTHLGYSACRKVVENGGKAELITAKDFFDKVKREFSNPDNSGKTVKRLSKLDYLVIDECDKIYGSQTEYLNLIDLIGKRYNEMLPTLVISNCNSLKELAELISLSCVDKLREGEKLAFIDEKDAKVLKYKSMRGKEEQAWLKSMQSKQK